MNFSDRTADALRRRAALFALFFVPGLGISSWVTRTPAIRDLLGASTAEMGLVLFGLSIGSMAGILCSGALVARFGTKPVVLVGILLTVLSMPTIGLGAAAGSAVVVAAGLFLFGAGMGGGEVALNVEGADIEQILDRPVLPALHGFFSFGTVIGASAGILFTATDFSVVSHL
ncbi:MAG: MFS transporter, partial [Mycetocola sp.]